MNRTIAVLISTLYFLCMSLFCAQEALAYNCGSFGSPYNSRECMENAVIDATARGDGYTLADLLAMGYSPSVSGRNGITPLMIAAKNNDVAIARLLLQNGAYTDMQDYAGNTALCYAVQYDSPDMIKFLQSAGSSVNVNCNFGSNVYCLSDLMLQPTAQQEYGSGGYYVEEEVVYADRDYSNWILGGLGLLAAGGLVAWLLSLGGDEENKTVIINHIHPKEDDPTDYQDDEYYVSNVLPQIHASSAYARGYTGRTVIRDANRNATGEYGEKIKVALVDSGVDLTHPDLIKNLSTNLTGTNLTGIGSSNDPSNTACSGDIDDLILSGNVGCFHGTFLAGIIAAEKNQIGMHGVAYDAELIPYKVDLSSNRQYTEAIINAVSSKDAFVVNNSYNLVANSSVNAANITYSNLIYHFAANNNQSGVDFVNSMVQAVVNNDAILVFGAGNQGYSESGGLSALPRFYSELFGHFINVVATNQNGTALIASSNDCGATAQWCMAAPGQYVVSTVPTGSTGENVQRMIINGKTYTYAGTLLDDNSTILDSVNGTSVAAATVSGAAAVLKGAFPYLSADDIVNILFESATDLGAAGVDSVYGHGLLNLDAATRTLGQVVLNSTGSVTGASYTLDSSYIASSPVFGNSLSSIASMTVFDKYNRSYEITNAKIRVNDYKEFNISDRYKVFGETKAQKEFQVSDNITSHFTQSSNTDGGLAIADAGVSANLGKVKLGFSYEEKMGKNKDKESAALIDETSLSNPFMNVASKGYSFQAESYLLSKLKVTMKNFFGKIRGNKDTEDVGTLAGSMLRANFEPTKTGSIFTEAGFVQEKNTFLGSEWNGAFSIADNTRTYFFGVGAEQKVTDRFKLFGQYYTGISNPQSNGVSLVQDFTTVKSDSFALGAEYQIDDEAKTGLILSQPLRIAGGSVNMNMPTGRDLAGNIFYDNQNMNLSSSAQEYDLQGYYKLKSIKGTEFYLGGMYRVNPYNDASRDDEGIVMMKLKQNLN